MRPRLDFQAFRHATDSESLHNNGEDYNDIGHHQEKTPFCFLGRVKANAIDIPPLKLLQARIFTA
ncbi:MAG: hypothetical protein F4X92_06860 [Gammaproteobacteria bacterium]|nr:hypothetical protein [Gammaproteobacteria bacterium]